jgi:hypothetical protein
VQEVTVALRFVSPCLGTVRRLSVNQQVVFGFNRDSEDRIIFLSGHWRSLLSYAARVANTGQALVNRITWDLVVEGEIRRDWRRFVVRRPSDPKGRDRYALHEAFPPGSRLTLNAVLPDGLSIKTFSRLLTIVGKYKGLSPFRDDRAVYGRFEVLSVVLISS